LSQTRMEGPIGGLTTHNIEYGWLEGLLRGFRSGYLKSFEYKQLSQCETFEDVKLTLGDTDYAHCLSNVSKLNDDVIIMRCRQKFVAEWEFIRSQAVGPLATFLEFITYEHLIKAICFIIRSLMQGADREALFSKIHPLAKHPLLKSVLILDNFEGSEALMELYKTVLVDMPVARYFEQYFMQENVKGENAGREIQAVYTENEIDIVTNRLQKLWLEDFYAYTQRLGGETARVMKQLLEFEADRRAISITLNSFNSNLNEPGHKREWERRNLYCNFGTLYPECTQKVFNTVGDVNALQAALAPYAQFRDIFSKAAENGRTVEDQLYVEEVRLNLEAFEGQSHFGAYYAWVKLKQQEERNLQWILKMIAAGMGQKEKDSKWIKIY